MTRTLALLTSCLAVLGQGAPAQQVVKGRVVTDKGHGYKLTLPQDWSVMPVHVDSERLVGWFQSDRLYNGEPDSPGGSVKPRRATICVAVVDKPAEGKRVWDYEYRLSRQLRGEEYKATKEPAENEGMKLLQWDVRVTGPGPNRRRLRAWEFSLPERNLVVEFSVLEQYFAELETTAMRVLRSLRTIEATPLPKRDPILDQPFALREWLDLTVMERHRRRKLLGSSYEQFVLARLPRDWTVHEGRNLLLLSHADAKTTRKVQVWIEAFYKWLEERFGGLAADYPIRTVVRFCANRREFDAYHRSGGWPEEHDLGNREIVMCNDRGVLDMDGVLWSVFRRYMLDVAPEVYFNMPVWLDQGLRGLIAQAQMQRGKLVFPSSVSELTVYHEIERSKNARVWTVVDMMNDPYFGYIPDKAERDGFLVLQSRVLLRFFDGPGKRCRAVGKDFLLRYCAEIQKLVRELDLADPQVTFWDAEDTVRQKLEQARDAKLSGSRSAEKVTVPSVRERWKSYMATVRKRKPAFLKELHSRVCNWSKAEWTQVERGYDIFRRSKTR